MKRTILVLLAVFALGVVASVATGTVEIDGAPRLLIVAGAVVLLVGVIDGLRRPTLDTGAATDAAEATGTEPAPVAPGLVDTTIDLSDKPPAAGAISDDEVHMMIMAAVSQGALAEVRPHLRAVPDEPSPPRALAS